MINKNTKLTPAEKKHEQETADLKKSLNLHLDFLEKHIKNLRYSINNFQDLSFAAETFCNAVSAIPHLIMRDALQIRISREFWRSA